MVLLFFIASMMHVFEFCVTVKWRPLHNVIIDVFNEVKIVYTDCALGFEKNRCLVHVYI